MRRWRELGEAPVEADATIPEIAAAIAAGRTRRQLVRAGSARARKVVKVHGKGVEPLRLAAAEPEASRGRRISCEDPRKLGGRRDEIARVEMDVGQSSRNQEGRVVVLEAAIERVTRALGSAADEVIPELVAERRAMR